MTSKSVKLQFEGDRRFTVSNPAGGTFILDPQNPQSHLSPMEALLGALGGCTGYDVVSIMEKKKQKLVSYRVEVTGEQVEDYPKRYSKIVVTHIGSGPDITLQAMERAVFLSHSKYCSVSASLNMEVETRVIIE